MEKQATDMMKRVNKCALILITIIDLFMVVGYIGDFQKHNISFGFMMIVEIITI